MQKRTDGSRESRVFVFSFGTELWDALDASAGDGLRKMTETMKKIQFTILLLNLESPLKTKRSQTHLLLLTSMFSQPHRIASPDVQFWQMTKLPWCSYVESPLKSLCNKQYMASYTVACSQVSFHFFFEKTYDKAWQGTFWRFCGSNCSILACDCDANISWGEEMRDIASSRESACNSIKLHM